MIQDIRDRVPVNVLSNNAIRYGVYDEEGKFLRYEYIKREDEAVEEGTPINRALLSNIQGDLYSSDRYNTVEVVAGQEEAFVSGNIFPTTWEAVTTGVEYVSNDNSRITASSYRASANTADKAFDNISNTMWRPEDVSGNAEHTITIELAEPRKIRQVYISMYINNMSKFDNIYIQGSKDGVDYTNLYDVGTKFTTESIKASTVTLDNIDFYKFYRVYIYGQSDYGLGVYAFDCVEHWGSKEIYINTLNLPLVSYEKGKIVNIESQPLDIQRDTTIKTTNIFPTSWTEEVAYTKYASDGYVLESSSTRNSSAPPSYACNGDESGTPWESVGNTSEEWIKMTCPNPTKITKMRAKISAFGNTSGFSKAIIQGSKNNADWIDLYEVSAYQTSATDMFLDNTDYYTYYRIVVYIAYLNTNVGAMVDLWEVIEWEKAENIETITSFENPYLNINNLGTKLINGTINVGEKYDLIYNGESWDIIQATNVISGIYSGTGDSVTIDLGFKPRAVFVYPACTVNTNYIYQYQGVASEKGNSPNIEITNTGFIAKKAGDWDIILKSYTYQYVAFK